MNRDLVLLLARYCALPLIVRMICVGLADNFAISLRNLRLSYMYSMKYDIPIRPRSAEFYTFLYDNKKKCNNRAVIIRDDIYCITNLFLYNSDRLNIMSAITNANEYITRLLYKYNDKLSASYYYNKLKEFYYSRLVKYINVNNCNYLFINNILQINYWCVKFNDYNFKLYGYNNFSRYYKSGELFLSSLNGQIIVYYETGAIMIKFSYNPAPFYSNYKFNRDSLCIYSPLGTRLL